jgi:spore maturation protein CgeB
MRALVVAPGPEFSVMDVYRGWVRGLAAVGCDVRQFNLHDRIRVYTEMEMPRDGEHVKVFNLDAAVEMTLEGLRGQVYDFWPDVIVFVSGFFLNTALVDFLRSRGHKVVIVHTESPYEDDRQLKLAPAATANIVNDPTNLELFRLATERGRAWYFPHAYDPAVHHDQGRTDAYDFSFVGTGYASRIRYMEAVDFGDARVALAGNWGQLDDDSPLRRYTLHADDECIDNYQTAELYRSSICSANLYRREANRPDLSAGWAMGPREVELAATRTFFARDPRPESDEVFPMLPTVTSPDELAEVIAWARTHETEREEAAAKAQAAIADRTFAANAARLLTLLDA